MTPKKKARELVVKMFESEHCGYKHIPNKNYCDCVEMEIYQAKQCALIAVEEMLGEYQSMSDLESVLVINNKLTFVVHQLVYWMEVKQEIGKL